MSNVTELATESPGDSGLQPGREIWARHRVAVLLVAGAMLAAALAFIISRLAEPRSGTIAFEFDKLLIQALLIGAVGGCLSAAIQEARRRQDQDERRRTFRREHVESLLHDIDEDYRLIKRSRRMLRLEVPIRHSSYRTEMINLEDIQRSLEELEANISRLQQEKVLDRLGTVRRHVLAMERYVKALWSEYEGNASHSNETLTGKSVQALRAFTAHIDDTESSFDVLKTSYRAARLDLLGQLARIAGASDRDTDAQDQPPTRSPEARPKQIPPS
jgi:hypothetical protein